MPSSSSAVRAAADGRTYLNPELGARMAAAPPAPAGPPDDLTERELEILRLIALGHTNAEIAGQLYLSVRTVESHRAHIQQKTRRATRAELVRYALDHGLLGRLRRQSGKTAVTAVPRARRLDLQLAAHQRRALAHPRQPEAGGRLRGVEAAPVVGYAHAQRIRTLLDRDVDARCAGMLADVGQRLLHEPVDRGLELGIEGVLLDAHVQPDLQAFDVARRAARALPVRQGARVDRARPDAAR